MDKTSKCQWSKCEAESDIIYLGCGLCDKHWTKSCDMEPEDVRRKLGIKEKSVDMVSRTPNEETIAAIEEGRKRGLKTFANVYDLMDDANTDTTLSNTVETLANNKGENND